MGLAADIEPAASNLDALRETYTGSDIVNLVRDRRHAPTVRTIDLFLREFRRERRANASARAREAFIEFLRTDTVPWEVARCLFLPVVRH